MLFVVLLSVLFVLLFSPGEGWWWVVVSGRGLGFSLTQFCIHHALDGWLQVYSRHSPETDAEHHSTKPGILYAWTPRVGLKMACGSFERLWANKGST